MKRFRSSFPRLIFALVLCAAGKVDAQWSNAARLSDPAHSGDIKEPKIAGRSAGGFHAVYRRLTGSATEIYSRSWQAGALKPAVLVHSLGFLAGGDICEAGDGSVHMVWENWDDTNEQIWWARSTDGGLTFPAKQSVSAYGTNPNGQAKNPMVVPYGSASSAETLVLSWGAPPLDRTYHNRFNGTAFLGHTAGFSTSNSYAAWGAARSPVDGSVWRTYGREPSNDLWQIYIRRFNGSSWAGEEAVSTHTGTAFASRPQVAINAAGEIMVIWDAEEGVFYRLRSATGVWGAMGRLDDGYTPALTAIPGSNDFYVAHPYPAGSWNHIVGRRWSAGAWSARERISNALADDYSPNCDLTADGLGTIFCSWEYWGSGKPVAYYALRAEVPPAVLVSPLNGEGFPAPATFTLTAAPGTAAIALNKVEFFQNGVKLGEKNAAPWTWPVTGLGAGTWRFHVVGTESSGRSMAAAPSEIVVAEGSLQPLVATGSAWRYLDNGTNQGTAWKERNFSDTAWKSGGAPLGYGDGDEATVVEDNATAGYSAADTARYITTYFRRTFSVPGPAAIKALMARIVRDDGAALYVNGTEVWRQNLADGAAYDALATATVSGAEESQFFSFTIPPSALVPGSNVIAVEVHQVTASSSDLSFELELKALKAAPTAPTVAIATPASSFGAPASFAVTADVTDADGDVAKVEFFKDGVKVGEDSSAPFSFQFTDVAVGSVEIGAKAWDATGLSSPTANRTFVVSATLPSSLTAAGSEWRHLDSATAAPAGWNLPGFSDAAWSAGATQIGFGDGDESTVIDGGPAATRHMTVYFRRSFQIADVGAVRHLTLRLLCDDGAVVYLNGFEVARYNMPAGPVAYGTAASTAIGGSDENAWHFFELNLARLSAGNNVLAAEVHQSGATSSDLSFDAALDGYTGTSVPVVATQTGAGSVTLTWPSWAAGWALQASPDLVLWAPVGGTAAQIGSNSVITLPSPGVATFYRLVAP